MRVRPPLTNVLSIDVEEWFQAEVYARAIPRDRWASVPSRVASSTNDLLRILAGANVRATFFVLGAVAKRLPDLVRGIASEGHEIASHGWSHTPIWNLGREAFFNEVSASRKLLQDLSGQPVLGYRAPTFSITSRTLWAVDELLRAGYRYDSSVFPTHHDRYGIPDAKKDIHVREGGLWEIPPSVLEVGPLGIPVAGGGYLRLYPFIVTRLAIQLLNERLGRPAVVYVHPWEFDPLQPTPDLPRISKFRHTVGIAANQSKLGRLLAEFRFGTCEEALARAGASLAA
jgi:polysaccharide deacetylase family protein (PEP-CTERM system associated)